MPNGLSKTLEGLGLPPSEYYFHRPTGDAYHGPENDPGELPRPATFTDKYGDRIDEPSWAAKFFADNGIR